MKKVIIVSIILSAVLLLSSCFGLGSRVAMLNKDGDSAQADARMEQIVAAIKSSDSDAMKNMFSEVALEEAEDIDGGIKQLFAAFPNGIDSWERTGGSASESMDHGTREKSIIYAFDVYADDQEYILTFLDEIINTEHPDEIGLYRLNVFTSLDNKPDAYGSGIFVSIEESESSSSMPEESGRDEPMALQLYDLIFTIPAGLSFDTLHGAETSVYFTLELDESGDTVSWLSISPNRPILNKDPEPVNTDESGRPILTKESVMATYTWDTVIHEVLGQGELEIGGLPAAYIEVLLSGTEEGDPINRVRFTSVVYDETAYEFLYSSYPEQFENHLPMIDGIIASAYIEPKNGTNEASFWDVTVESPTKNWITTTVTEDEVFIYNQQHSVNPLSFYVKHDNTVLYTDAMLDDPKQIERLLRIYSGDLMDDRFREFLSAAELSRERTELGGIPALQVTYRTAWQKSDNQESLEYFELLLFVHNYDLYIVQGKTGLDREADLIAFLKPLLASITVHNPITQPPEGRPRPHSDSVQWLIDTYLFETLGSPLMDAELWGGQLPTEKSVEYVRSGLRNKWDITDRQTADDVISRLYAQGDRAAFRELATESGIFEMNEMEFGLASLLRDWRRQEAMRDIYENTRESYQTYGDKALSAWDYCRVIQLYAEGYVAGYYSYSEALDLALPAAKELQKSYSSWDEMYRDYLAGFYFSSGFHNLHPDEVKDPGGYNVTEIPERLENVIAAHGATGSLPWDLPLVPDWNGKVD